MKTLVAGCFAAVVALALPGARAVACEEHSKDPAHACNHPTTGTATAGDASAKGDRLLVPVNGMHCSRCAERVSAAVAKVKGVKFVETSLDSKQATVVVDRAEATPGAVVAAIKAAGYEPGKPTTN